MRYSPQQAAFLSALVFSDTNPGHRITHNSPSFLLSAPPRQATTESPTNVTTDMADYFVDKDVFVDPLPIGANKAISDDSVATLPTASASSVASDSSYLSTLEFLDPTSYAKKSLKSTLRVDEVASTYYTKWPWIVGHRGCIYQELENTRAGFQKCAEMGSDAVELDVFLLKCGTLIVFHGGGTDENPGDLLDYCGRPGNIFDLTYEQALQLKFNPTYAEFACPSEVTAQGKIPTLEQVLSDAKKSGLNVKIELKGEGTVEPSLEVVESLGMVDQCSFSSFDHSRLAHLRRLRPQRNVYKTGALFVDVPKDYLKQAEDAGATEIHLQYDTCTPQIISAIHKAGFGSMAWFRGPIGMTNDCLEKYWDVGNEDESMYDALLRTGVQQMCINKPDVLIGLRKKLNA